MNLFVGAHSHENASVCLVNTGENSLFLYHNSKFRYKRSLLVIIHVILFKNNN
jgi:hypothetical protein